MNATDYDPAELDPSIEDESDLEPGGISATLSSSDWTVETILNQMRRGNIQLNPRFQRRDAWTDQRKSRFVESLMLGLPIPQLVLADNKDERGKYIVIDGKQRLLTLRRFGPHADEEADVVFEPLALTGLKALPDLNGKTYADLTNDPTFAQDLAVYDNQTIRTVVVRQWPDEAYLYRIFHRLNTESVPLSPQELRQALHPGKFLDFADAYSANSKQLQMALRIDGPDFRMRDVEILVRFFAFSEFLPSYRGNLKAFLDETSKNLNEVWDERQAELERLAASCDAAIDATISIFNEDAFARWSGERYETRFNRAVFDVMTFYFKRHDIAEVAVARDASVRESFVNLCDTDPAFVESIQTTTKSVTATYTRLRAWGDALAGATDLQFARPELVGKRIQV